MREIRNASDEIKRDITRSATEMKRDMNLNNHLKNIEDPIKSIEKSIMEEPKVKETKNSGEPIKNTDTE